MRTAHKLLIMMSGQTRWVPPLPAPTLSGTELFVNNTFSAWTSDNPDGWTVGGEPTCGYVSQVGPGQLYGGGGTGRCNIYATGNYVTMTQNVLTAGGLYRRQDVVDAFSGVVGQGYIGSYPSTVRSLNAVGTYTYTGLARTTNGNFLGQTGTNLTLASASCRAILTPFSGVLTTRATHVARAGITENTGWIGGVWCAGDAVTPSTYVMAVIDRLYIVNNYVRVYKYTPTAAELGAIAITYSAGATLELQRTGSDVVVKYNNATIATYTLTEPALLAGRCAGLVSTDVSGGNVTFTNPEVCLV